MRCGLLRFGSTVLAHLSGTITRMGSSRNILSVVGSDNFCLNMNVGRTAMGLSQPGRHVVLERKTATLLHLSGRAELQAGRDGELNYATLILPRLSLRELSVNAEDLLATALDPRLPALRHLRRYLDIVSEPDGLGSDPALIEHVDTTILDLVALTLGAGRDAREIARARGLRAARVQEILAEIRAGFADPEFVPATVATRLGLSSRYVQELLQESGTTFTERVLELRLQKARAALAKSRFDRLKVSDIAFACGFNEVSYFNRCFRRRFGASPTECRGGVHGTDG